MLLNKLPTWANCKRITHLAFAFAIGTGSVMLLASCATHVPNVTEAPYFRLPSLPPAPSTALAINALPGFEQDSLDGLPEAIGHQCNLKVRPEPWPVLCEEFSQQRSGPDGLTGLRQWISQRFVATALRSTNGNSEGLITGYYEPVVTGSRLRENALQVPLYRRPPDLVRAPSNTGESGKTNDRARILNGEALPYYSRAEIENKGVLGGLELVFIDDSVDAFFLQIQGSGRVLLREPNSPPKTIRVGFADHNGFAYKAIGSVLRQRNAMSADQINAESIKQWLRSNPAQATEVMQTNQRFIFFTELAEGNRLLGPIGALGVPLTAERSLATDPSTIPLGSLVFLSTTDPETSMAINKLMVSQDIGVAIRGEVRADLFWGLGAQAESKASAMKQPGKLWLLQPKDRALSP
jgi:membrane-bound lytic murein transglycosylase A